jgi:hypothetical protein
MESKKSLWLLLIVGVLLVAVVVLVTLKPKKETAQENKNTQPKLVHNDIEPNKVPEKIPTDFPFEAGATIAENYVLKSETTDAQATRKFQTKKTLAENYKIYEDYFKKNGWTITATLDQPTIKSITAVKGKLQANLSMSENTETKARTVDVSITDAANPQQSAATAR